MESAEKEGTERSRVESAPRGSHCGGIEFVASRAAAGGESCAAGFYFKIAFGHNKKGMHP